MASLEKYINHISLGFVESKPTLIFICDILFFFFILLFIFIFDKVKDSQPCQQLVRLLFIDIIKDILEKIIVKLLIK